MASVRQFWFAHYVNHNMCSLCGNHGVIDSRGFKDRSGTEIGRLNWCICPNGMALRRSTKRETPDAAQYDRARMTSPAR